MSKTSKFEALIAILKLTAFFTIMIWVGLGWLIALVLIWAVKSPLGQFVLIGWIATIILFAVWIRMMNRSR